MTKIADKFYYLVRDYIGDQDPKSSYLVFKARSPEREELINHIICAIESQELKPSTKVKDIPIYARKLVAERLMRDPRLNRYAHFFKKGSKLKDPVLRKLAVMEIKCRNNREAVLKIRERMALREVELMTEEEGFPDELKPFVEELVNSGDKKSG